MLKQIFFPYPSGLTTKQNIYLYFTQGLGAGIVDGAANFGIATAMYHGQVYPKRVTMWVFSQNTIAGDLGVTCLVQCVLSMIITSALVHTDLHHSQIKPMPFVYPHTSHLPDPQSVYPKWLRRGLGLPPSSVLSEEERAGVRHTEMERQEAISGSSSESGTVVVPVGGDGIGSGSGVGTGDEKLTKGKIIQTEPIYTRENTSKIKYNFLLLIRFIFEGTLSNCILDRPHLDPTSSSPTISPSRIRTFFSRLIITAIQGLAIGVVFGLPLWCLAIVILGPIYGHRNMGNAWAPEVIKLVFGFLLGIVTNPVIALLALGSQAEHHLILVEEANGDVEKGLVNVEGPTSYGDGEEARSMPPSTPPAGRGSSHLESGIQTPQISRTMTPRTPMETIRSHSGVGGRRMSYTASVRDLAVWEPAGDVGGAGVPGSGMMMGGSIAPGTPRRDTQVGANILDEKAEGAKSLGPAAAKTTPKPSRPRAYTSGSTTSYYSLGGTGGRAKRTRAGSSASVAQVGRGGGAPVVLGAMIDGNQHQQHAEGSRPRSNTHMTNASSDGGAASLAAPGQGQGQMMIGQQQSQPSPGQSSFRSALPSRWRNRSDSAQSTITRSGDYQDDSAGSGIGQGHTSPMIVPMRYGPSASTSGDSGLGGDGLGLELGGAGRRLQQQHRTDLEAPRESLEIREEKRDAAESARKRDVFS